MFTKRINFAALLLSFTVVSAGFAMNSDQPEEGSSWGKIKDYAPNLYVGSSFVGGAATTAGYERLKNSPEMLKGGIKHIRHKTPEASVAFKASAKVISEGTTIYTSGKYLNACKKEWDKGNEDRSIVNVIRSAFLGTALFVSSGCKFFDYKNPITDTIFVTAKGGAAVDLLCKAYTKNQKNESYKNEVAQGMVLALGAVEIALPYLK